MQFLLIGFFYSMENASLFLLAGSVLLAALVLIYWHARSWRVMQLTDLMPNELDFYRRQYRRRMQTSVMLGILGLMIGGGESLTRWIDSRTFFIAYWLTVLLLVCWMLLLAVLDIWATKTHFNQMRQKCLMEQAKLNAEARRVQSARGNGKPHE